MKQIERMKHLSLLIWFLVFQVVIFSSQVFAEEKPVVVCTTGIMADLLKNLAGEQVSIKPLMGAGVDPHLYKPTHKDISLLSGADIIVYHGLTLEGKLEPILEKLRKRGKVVIAASEFGRKDLLLAAEDYENAFDPHLWFDPMLWKLVAVKVSSELSFALPEKASEIQASTAEYLQKLSEVDQWTRQQIGTIPEKSRVLVTAHDAFRYFGRRYGIEVDGLQGISTSSDYGLRDVKNLAGKIIDRKLKAIFMESSVAAKFIESLQEAVQARGHEVAIGGTLYSDALGPEGSGADTYLGMLKHNVETVVGGLK